MNKMKELHIILDNVWNYKMIKSKQIWDEGGILDIDWYWFLKKLPYFALLSTRSSV